MKTLKSQVAAPHGSASKGCFWDNRDDAYAENAVYLIVASEASDDFRKQSICLVGTLTMLCQLIQYLQSQTKKKSGKPHETTMNNQGGEPEWGSLAPVKYPSEARAVRVNNREVKQKCSNTEL